MNQGRKREREKLDLLVFNQGSTAVKSVATINNQQESLSSDEGLTSGDHLTPRKFNGDWCGTQIQIPHFIMEFME